MLSIRNEHQGQENDRSPLEEIERAIMQISWLSQRQFMQLLDDDRFRLTVPQFYTLLHLFQTGEECKMSDLADATHQSAASLTGIVDRLLEKQLVERTRHERDRRQVMVAVTQRGRSLIGEVRQARREQIQSALATLNDNDADRLIQMLDQVLAGMARVIERSEGGRWA
ncbi:MAG: MarR family transcriptional regulator [Blastochloris sp.]|nr:MarR family transcriptional regulator [Blastochloris sp.]